MVKTVIPKKYLHPKNALKAFQQLRKWCADSASLMRAAEEVVDALGQEKTKYRQYLTELLAMIMGLRSEEFSRKCVPGMDLFECRSVGERIYILNGDLDFLIGPERSECIAPCVWEWDRLKLRVNLLRHPWLLHRDEASHVLSISINDEIYACRHKDGTLRIFILNDCADDILIDEERFNDECPLYFTESDHFISPVFKLKVIMVMLNFFLAEVGYPSVNIIPEVIFTSSAAHIINRDSYMPGGELYSDWKGINVVTRRDIKGLYILDSIVSFISDDSLIAGQDNLVYKLLEALSATAIMYRETDLGPDTLNLTAPKLRRMAKKFGIMTDKKHN